MRQLEIVHLRMAGACPRGLLEQICNSLSGHTGCTARVYRHAQVEGDLGVHLQLQAEGNTGLPSALGLHVAAALREHGMVEHTVWLEEKTAPRGS